VVGACASCGKLLCEEGKKTIGGKIYGESCSKSVVGGTSGQTAVVAMMVDNGLSTLPNPVIIAADMELARLERKIGTNCCP